MPLKPLNMAMWHNSAENNFFIAYLASDVLQMLSTTKEKNHNNAQTHTTNLKVILL